MLDDDDRVPGVDEPVERAHEDGHVGGVEPGRGLVEQVEPPLALAGLRQRPGELQPLRLAAREGGGGLRQREVAEAQVDQRPEGLRHAPRVGEEPHHLHRRQVERLRDREPLALDLEHLVPEPPSVAGRAAHEDVGQELHLDLLVPRALTHRTGPGCGVEREHGGLEAAGLCLGCRRECLAERLEHLHVRCGVHARACPERRLVDERDAGQGRRPVDPVAVPGLRLADAEVPAQVAVQYLVDE